MRHYSVLGDLKDKKDISAAIFFINKGQKKVADLYNDTEAIAFMDIIEEDEKKNLLKVILPDNHMDYEKEKFIFFEQLSSLVFYELDLSDFTEKDFTSFLDFLQTIKSEPTIHFMNPIKKNTKIGEIRKWLGAQVPESKLVVHELKENTEDEEFKFYALGTDKDSNEMLLEILQYVKAINEKQDIIISKIDNLTKTISKIRNDRLPLINKYESSGSLENIGYAQELRDEIDEMICRKADQLSETEKENIVIDLSEYPFLSNYDPESKKLIKSCLIVEKAIEGKVGEDFDYSLCSSGYWRAIELELNLSIIEALRYFRSVIDTIPSNNQSKIPHAVFEYGGERFDHYKNKNVRVDVNINKVYGRERKLGTLMFGDLNRLSQNYKENGLKEIFDKISEFRDEAGFYTRLENYLTNLETIIYKIRNKCSHVYGMKEKEFEDLKSALFDENCGTLAIIAQIKNCVYDHDFWR